MDVCLLGELFLPPILPLHVHIHTPKKEEQNADKGIILAGKTNLV